MSPVRTAKGVSAVRSTIKGEEPEEPDFRGLNGTDGWIRTSDRPLRRRMLYPAELRLRI